MFVMHRIAVKTWSTFEYSPNGSKVIEYIDDAFVNDCWTMTSTVRSCYKGDLIACVMNEVYCPWI